MAASTLAPVLGPPSRTLAGLRPLQARDTPFARMLFLLCVLHGILSAFPETHKACGSSSEEPPLWNALRAARAVAVQQDNFRRINELQWRQRTLDAVHFS